MMEVNPKGWKSRRDKARRRSETMTHMDRAQIRHIRRRHYEAEARKAEAKPDAKASEAEAPTADDGGDDIEQMSREAMIAELRAADKFVPPKIGDPKLRQRVRDLRDEKAAEVA